MQPVLIVLLLIALAMDLVLIAFASTRQDRSRSIYLSTLTTFLFAYTLGYLLEIMSGTPEAVKIALCVENVGIPAIAPLFLLTVLSLFNVRAMRSWMLPVALIYGMLMFGVVLSNDWHHLYYTSLDLTFDGTSHFARLGHGPLYAMQQCISISCMLISYVLIFSRFLRGTRKLRGQMAYFIMGSLIALAANVLNFSGVLPIGLDPTPFALTIGLAFVAVDLFKHRLMDIVAFASDVAVETMDDAMIVLDNDWCFLFCNWSAKELFAPLAACEGTEPATRMRWWPQELAPRRQAGQVTFRLPGRGGPSTVHRANVSKIVLNHSRQIGWSIVIRDITEMVRLMEQLEDLATLDPLTGILNRRHFFDMAQQEIERAARYGLEAELIMYDIDWFKRVNDTYGHAAGDYVLCAVADVIKGQLRSHDIFARYGGEEFVIFSACRPGSDIRSFAQRLCDAVAAADIVYEDVHISVTASFGVVRMHADDSFDDAMLAVDGAMYRAKAQGRNRVEEGQIPPHAQAATNENEA